jgi:hypothetical protein
MIADLNDTKQITAVELPSPANNIIARYLAAGNLFAGAMYKENPTAVVFLIIGFSFSIFWLIIKFYLWKRKPIDMFGRWLSDIVKYAVKHFKELFEKRKKT